MSKEQTEFIIQRTDDINTICITDPISEVYLEKLCEEYATLKLQEQAKEIERLKGEKEFIYEAWKKGHRYSYWYSEKQDTPIFGEVINKTYFEGKEYSECRPIECGYSNWDDAILLGTK